MSDIPGEISRVRGAFEQPTLTLLHQKHAPIIIAVFRTCVSRDTRTVPAARLHDQVESYLTELRQSGHAGISHVPGRDLCLRWMNSQWLVPTAEGDRSEGHCCVERKPDYEGVSFECSENARVRHTGRLSPGTPTP